MLLIPIPKFPDELWLLKKVSVYLLYNKASRVWTQILLFYFLFSIVIFAIYVSRSFSKHLLFQYFPSIFLYIYALLITVSTLHLEECIKFWTGKITPLSWKPPLIPKVDVNRKILDYKIFSLVTFGVLGAAFGMFLLHYDDMKDFLLPFKISEEMWPKYAYLTDWTFFVTFPAFLGIMLLQCLIYSYLYLSLMVQCHVVKLYLGNIGKGLCKDVLICKSAGYQEIIRSRLRVCIKRHVELQGTTDILLSELRGLSLTHTIFGIATMVCSLYFVMYNIVNSGDWFSTLHYVLILVGSLLSYTLMLKLAQSRNDEAEEVFHAATRCPWYLWNGKNRNMLLMLMMNCLQFKGYRVPGLGQIGLPVLTKVCQMCYSTASILYRLKT